MSISSPLSLPIPSVKIWPSSSWTCCEYWVITDIWWGVAKTLEARRDTDLAVGWSLKKKKKLWKDTSMHTHEHTHAHVCTHMCTRRNTHTHTHTPLWCFSSVIGSGMSQFIFRQCKPIPLWGKGLSSWLFIPYSGRLQSLVVSTLHTKKGAGSEEMKLVTLSWGLPPTSQVWLWSY